VRPELDGGEALAEEAARTHRQRGHSIGQRRHDESPHSRIAHMGQPHGLGEACPEVGMKRARREPAAELRERDDRVLGAQGATAPGSLDIEDVGRQDGVGDCGERAVIDLPVVINE
jgi:hypothetical protein